MVFAKIAFMGKKARKSYQKSEIEIKPGLPSGQVFEAGEVRKISFSRILLSFVIGLFLGLILLAISYYWRFEKTFDNRLYPGITINNIDLGGKSKEEVGGYFQKKNSLFNNTRVEFALEDKILATVSAEELKIGFDEKLISHQAYLLGRGPYFFSNLLLKTKAYLYGIELPIAIDLNKTKAEDALLKLSQQTDVPAKNALFTFSGGKVVAFNTSSEGKKLNRQKTLDNLYLVIKTKQNSPGNLLKVDVQIDKVSPKVTTEQANNLGIKELIGAGTSTFFHSIPNRVYNVGLAASRLNGILIPPDGIFSFNENLGDINSFTGYKQAYIIQNGKTILGDGGGVCQVSTTFFRAALNSGLPILERWAHAYRVGYYEQDQPPGLDATIFSPTNDLKIKNDTPGYILIQTAFDPENYRLTVYFYGQKDNRIALVSKPIISNQTPAPPDAFQDDPNLPKGQVRQVDFAAPGAKSVFSYEVKKNGLTIFNKTFVSNYRPWQAIFLRGTKE